MTDLELLQQARDALVYLWDGCPTDKDLIERLDDRLAQPEPVAGEWVEVDESCIRSCWCHVCNADVTVKVGGYDIPYRATTMILCPDCGNKRCPKANDHRNECTGSNELGQAGSAYADIPPPQREWKGLTEYEVGFLTVFDGLHDVEVPLLANFIRHIEAKLKEKNGF